MREKPPVWLTEAVEAHRPLPRMNDMICTCSFKDGAFADDRDLVVWTTDHLSREIHKLFYEAIAELFGDNERQISVPN